MSNVLKRGQFLSLDLSQNPLGDSGAFAHEFRFSAMKYSGVPQSAAEASVPGQTFSVPSALCSGLFLERLAVPSAVACVTAHNHSNACLHPRQL